MMGRARSALGMLQDFRFGCSGYTKRQRSRRVLARRAVPRYRLPLAIGEEAMIRALVQKLGLDKIGDLVADEAKRVQVEVLREERDILAKMVARLDDRIATFGGKRRGRPPKATPTPAIAVTPTPRPRRRRRIVHRPGETLRDMVVKALTKASAPVKVSVVVDLVKELGYKTAAKPSTLLTSIYHVLGDGELFRKMGKGVFALKAMPRAAATPRRGTRVGPLLAASKAGKPRRTKKAAAEQAPVAAPQAAPAEEKA